MKKKLLLLALATLTLQAFSQQFTISGLAPIGCQQVFHSSSKAMSRETTLPMYGQRAIIQLAWLCSLKERYELTCGI